MMVVLACMLAISAFADDLITAKTESEEYGTVIQLNADPGLDNAKNYVSTLTKIDDAGTDKDALCILTDGNTDNPSYYVFPSSYIVDEREDGKFDLIATALATSMAEFNTANGTSYFADYAITGSGGDKRLDSMVRFVFPISVLSASDSVCCIRKYPNLVEVRINHAINFSSAGKMFYNNKVLTTVMGFENVDGTKLPKTMFASCSALRYIKLPTNTVTIPGSFFQGAKGVNIVNMEELTQLTTIESWAFDGTQNLVITLPDSVTTLKTSAFESAFKQGGSLTINPASQLTTIGPKAFSGSVKLDSIYIPSTVTSIAENAFNASGITTIENFENCQITVIKKGTFEAASNLTSIKIPKTVTTIENAFNGTKNLKKVYIPDSVTSIADTFLKSSWSEAPANIVFLYIGKDASVLSACTRIAGANVIKASEYDEAGAYTGANIVVGYSNCVAYNNGVHGESAVGDIAFTTYYDDITVSYKCALCDMKVKTEIIPELFVCLGFSTPEDGRDGIAVGYTINIAAVKEYEKVSGKTLKYGVYAALKDKLGANDIFDENGKAIENAVTAQVSGNNFAAVEFKLFGFTDEYKDLKLTMGAYVITSDEESTEYSYLQAGAPNEGEKYTFISYNEVVAGKKDEA